MLRFRPVHGVLIVLLFVAAVVGAKMAFETKGGPGYELVLPKGGEVTLDLASLKPQEVRFYRFLNSGNQEVRFFVGKDAKGAVQVAYDADETCAKYNRGFRHEGEWVVCNKCDKSFRLAEVNAGGGGCKPVPLAHRVDGDHLLRIAEADILQGWRLFH